MNEQTYKKLIKKLNEAESRLCVFHQGSSRQRGTMCSVGLLNSNTDVSKIPEQELPLAHTMLHMFFNGSGGKDLSMKTIEKLHKEVSVRLKQHKKFDKLDELK